MQWPNFLKFKLPKFKIPLPLPKTFLPSHFSFYKAWKKFVRQIPTESRSIIKSYQHFIVMGNEKSGKTELIQGLIEQSQDLYPFETTFLEHPDIQFYLGPRQVIQEISFATLENRSIKIRKQIIKLWKKLYANQDPVILVTYDCSSNQNKESKEVNKWAQWIAGKITLLAEITKRPLKTRIALTYLDKIPGYIEFARFLKQQNISYTISLSSNFESDILANDFKEFTEKHLPLVLTTVSHNDYLKVLSFCKEMPLLFPDIEEFLRALATRVSFKEAIELDMVAFTSCQESSTSFALFHWKKIPSSALFFRYPMLKHQLAAVCMFLVCFSFILNIFTKLRIELMLVQRGVELLDLLQFTAFKENILPEAAKISTQGSNHFSSLASSHFYEGKLTEEKNRLAHRIRKHLMEPEYRKTILENKGELKYLYFVALMRSSATNRVGKFVLKNAAECAQTLNLEENLLKIYITYCSEPVPISQLCESKASPFLLLTSRAPWLSFLKKFQDVKQQPIFVEQTYEDIIRESEKLLMAISRLRNDPLVFGMATLLDEEGFVDNENVKTVHWIGENVDALENFLVFLKQTYVPPTNLHGMSPSQFFVMIKEFASKTEAENELYNFALMNQAFSFDSNLWTQQVVAHNIEKSLQEYMALNADTDGSLFFHNTAEPPVQTLAYSQTQVPFFKTNVTIPGRYSRIDYERKVRSTVEKLAVFIESLNINPEEKKRFINFLVKESSNYVKTYQEKYLKVFDAYNIEAASIKDLKQLLTDLTKYSSGFYEFLRTVQHQTSSFAQPLLTLKNMDELNQFEFLNKVLAEKEGKSPIQEYQQLMAAILHDLDAADTQISEGYPLYLTSIEKMSVDIFQKTSASYLKKTQDCLGLIGVPDRFRHLFVKPIELLYEFGLKELKTSVEHYWKTHVSSQVGEVFAKFPFNPNGTVFAAEDEVNALFNPKSKFYTDLEKIMSIFCHQQDGKWIAYDNNAAGLDESLYSELNRISKIGHTLWDCEGKPKPITVKVCAIPFTKDENAKTLPMNSSIVAGANAVHNINSDPAWQQLNVEWWKSEQSLIGMTLKSKTTNSKTYRSLQPGASLWSFFALLKEGQQKEDNEWNWKLASREGQDPQPVSFRFESNPHQLLSF
jgi:hypothetical protein